MDDQDRSRSWRAPLAAVGLAAVGAGVFASAFRLPFVADDYGYLEAVRRPGWWHSGAIWDPRGAHGNHLYRPVLYLWFGLLDHVFGLHPVWFHIANGLLVLAAGVMTGLVARRLGLRSGAWAAAVVFCLHASMSTPVGWTSAASSPLGTALALGSIYCLLRPHVRVRDAVVACGLFALALMTREVVAVAPAIVVLSRWVVDVDRSWASRCKRCVLASAPLWVVLVGYAAVRRASGFTSTAGAYTQHLGTQGFRNFGQLAQFATELGYARRNGALVAGFWVVVLVLCVLALLLARLPQVLIGIAWAIVGVLPVIFLATHAMDYYYIDFALPGLAIAFAALFQWLYEASPARDRVGIAVVGLVGLVIVGSYAARREQRVYLDPFGKGSAQVIREVKRTNPHPAPGSVVRVPISAAAAAFSDYPDLIRVIYDDPTLEIAYSG